MRHFRILGSLVLSSLALSSCVNERVEHLANYDYFRDEIRDGHPNVVHDIRDEHVLDRRERCVYTNHLKEPTWQEKIALVRKGSGCEHIIMAEAQMEKEKELGTPRTVQETLKMLERFSDLQVVFFDFDKDILTPRAVQKLDTLIAFIGDAKELLNVKIAGHADRFGTNTYNIDLSKRRAVRVRDYLLTKGGITAEVIDLKAFGETQPVTTCNYEERNKQIACMLADRRVEIIIDAVKEVEKTITRPERPVYEEEATTGPAKE